MLLWNWHLTSWIEKLISISWLVSDASFFYEWFRLELEMTNSSAVNHVSNRNLQMDINLFVTGWKLSYQMLFFSYCYVICAVLVWASSPRSLIDPLFCLFLCSICWLENEAWPSMVGALLFFDQNLLHRRTLHVVNSESREW